MNDECRNRDPSGRCRCAHIDHDRVPRQQPPQDRRRFPRQTETLPDVRVALAEMGRGSLQRRAEDLAKLVSERDAEIARLRELLDSIELTPDICVALIADARDRGLI